MPESRHRSRHIGFTSLAANGRQVELLTVGRDQFRRLPPGRQRETGKLWLWSEADDGYWHQMVAAMPHIASCTGSGAESLSGKPVRQCSFLLKPQRTSLLTRLSKREDPSVAELYEALRAVGRDRVFIDVWLADDHDNLWLHDGSGKAGSRDLDTARTENQRLAEQLTRARAGVLTLREYPIHPTDPATSLFLIARRTADGP